MAKGPVTQPTVDSALRREMAALKATEAPVIFFNIASTFGNYSGVGNITLECGLHIVVDGATVNESRTVAHLRFPLDAIGSLRKALDHIENVLKPVPDALKN